MVMARGRITTVPLCAFLVCLLVAVTKAQPFGTKWSEIDQSEQESEQILIDDPDEDPTAKEKIAQWMLRKIEAVILKKIKETSFVDLVTGNGEKDGGTSSVTRDDHPSSSNSQLWAALILFVVAFGICIWCVVVRHLLRGVTVILAGAFFLFMLIVLFYPHYDDDNNM